MENYLFTINPLLNLSALFGVVLLIIYGSRLFFRRQSKTSSENKNHTSSIDYIVNRTKYPEVNTFRISGSLFSFSFAAAIYVCLIAFNWTQYDSEKIFNAFNVNDIDVLELIAPPPTTQRPPPPPPPPLIEEIPPELDPIEDPEFVDYSPDIEEATEVPDPPIEIASEPPPRPLPPPPPENPDIPEITFAEHMPRFPGCEDILGTNQEKKLCAEKKLLAFIASRIKYPPMARENGVKGMVVISFVVNLEGELEDLKIVRDQGAGLGKEALRVVNQIKDDVARWTPGRQGGRNVRVRFNLPIKFKLE